MGAPSRSHEWSGIVGVQILPRNPLSMWQQVRVGTASSASVVVVVIACVETKIGWVEDLEGGRGGWRTWQVGGGSCGEWSRCWWWADEEYGGRSTGATRVGERVG